MRLIRSVSQDSVKTILSVAARGREVNVDDDQQSPALKCPRCGSRTIDEYRMGIVRYRITNGREEEEEVDRDGQDAVGHRCADCYYASDTDIWYVDEDSTPNPFIARADIWN